MHSFCMKGKLKNDSCPYCGNNPTSHLHAQIDSAICMFMNPLTQRFLGTYVGKVLFGVTNYILKGSVFFLSWVKIIRYDDDSSCISSDRGKVLADEAEARGWKMEVMHVFGVVTDAYRIIFPNGKKFYFSGLPRVGSVADVTAGWIDDKALLKLRLSKEGISVSHGASFVSLNEAERYFNTLTKPVIVKPRLGSRGRHTTTWLTDVNDFKKAFMISKQLGRAVIVEEHLIGSVYRATVVDGVLAGVLAGDPPRVTGDGEHTISELIVLKNKHRDGRVSAVQVTPGLETFLKRQNFTLQTILDRGITIDLSEKIGLSYGGKSREVTPDVHPKLREELERAAQIVDDPLLGFDFITTDVSADPDTVRWGIIECNSVPFINLHHDPLEGEPINVAKLVLDYLERELAV